MTLGRLFFAIFSYCWILISCQKDVLDSSSQRALKFSTDTLTFDTVFQTLGSATRSFRIYNPTDKSLLISNAYLHRGSQSQFRFNIDGTSSPSAQNITILPHDSAWVFVEVTVNPQTNPLLVGDSLIIEVNGGKQVVILTAYGQNAYFHRGEIIMQNTTWRSDKPHVILSANTSNGYVPGVVIPQGITLTIEENSKLYFGSSAGLLVLGSLHSEGTKTGKILMRGLRLERDYIHAAGQWLGILIARESIDNLIRYTTIDESAFGVWVGFQDKTDFALMKDDATRAEVRLENSSIRNAYYFALRSLNNIVKAYSCEFYTSTDYLIQLALGGEYEFIGCTIFNIQSKEEKGNLLLSNQFYDDATKTTHKHAWTTPVLFENTIIYSNTDEAIQLDIDKTINSESDYSFNHCLYNSKSNLGGASFQTCIRNQNPEFENTTVDQENLKLKSNSPAIDKGVSTSVTEDILGNPRQNGSAPDIGAYEY